MPSGMGDHIDMEHKLEIGGEDEQLFPPFFFYLTCHIVHLLYAVADCALSSFGQEFTYSYA